MAQSIEHDADDAELDCMFLFDGCVFDDLAGVVDHVGEIKGADVGGLLSRSLLAFAGPLGVSVRRQLLGRTPSPDPGRKANMARSPGGIWPIPVRPLTRDGHLLDPTVVEIRSSRRRQRCGVWRRARLWTSSMLAVLNFFHVGRLGVCPRWDEERPLSHAQDVVVRRLLALACRLARSAVAGCGPKLATISDYVDAVIPEAVGHSGGDDGGSVPESAAAPDEASCRVWPRALCPGSGQLQSSAVPVVASRLWRATAPPRFDPSPFLPGFELAAYLDPAILQHAGAPTKKPQPPPARQTGARDELLTLFKMWDSSGRLRLFPSDLVKVSDGIRIQAVAKDEGKDRLICNRQRANRREHRVDGVSRLLPGAYLLSDLVLDPGEVVDMWASDLSDMYHQFIVTEARAASNHVAFHLSAREARGFPEAWRRAPAKWSHRGSWVAAFATLPMGDGSAVDFACRAHEEVLLECGAVAPEALVRARCPLPAARRLDLLVVDDHCVLLRRPRGDRVSGRGVADSLGRARAAYSAAGLEENAGKGFSEKRRATVLGAHVDGEAGLIHADFDKLLRLALLSARVSRLRRVHGAVVRRLVAGWVFALGFARPGLAVFHSVFRWLGPVSQDGVRRALPRSVASELLAISVLSPLLLSDLRAQVSTTLFASDASEFGLGVVSAKISPELAREAWRTRERRGQYTRLAPAATTWARSWGLSAGEPGIEEDPLRAPWAPSPERVLIESFDFLAVGGGCGLPLVEACGSLGLRVGPAIASSVHAAWDLQSDRVLEWLIFLVARRRVFYFHCSPLSSSWCRGRAWRRRLDSPWGRPGLTETEVQENKVVQNMVALALAVARTNGEVALTMEHPRSSFLWLLPSVRRLASQSGFIDFDWCAFQRGPCHPTRLLQVGAPWTTPLARRCGGCGDHSRALRLGGAAVRYGRAPSASRSVFPNELCELWASLVLSARSSSSVVLGGPDADLMADVDFAASESLWLNELVGGTRFDLRLSRRVPRSEHINVREVQAIRAALELASGESPAPQRVLVLVDSLVTRGLVAKGRSASKKLNAEWSKCLPICLGQGLSVAPLFVPSRLNPADGPSRLSPVSSPSWPAPPFADTGDLEELEVWQRYPRQRRGHSPWARLVLRLVRFRGSAGQPRAGRRFDSTLGFPGEGPRGQSLPLNLRPAVVLLDGVGRNPEVLERRAAAVLLLQDWLRNRDVTWEAFLSKSPASVSRLLAAFGQHLYDIGRPLGVYAETINAVVDSRPELRGHLVSAWRAAWAWRGLVPALNHRACPVQVLRAMVSLTLLHDRLDVASVLLVGFLAFLRPGELIDLRVSDVLLPGRVLCRPGTFYVVIRSPKMRRLAARREHVHVAEPTVTAFLERALAGRAGHELVFQGGGAELRRLFAGLLLALGVPSGDLVGLTLASLRAGGATWYFAETRDLEAVRWRGRWGAVRTLEVYIQEVGALHVLSEVDQSVRDRVGRFAAALPALLSSAAA